METAPRPKTLHMVITVFSVRYSVLGLGSPAASSTSGSSTAAPSRSAQLFGLLSSLLAASSVFGGSPAARVPPVSAMPAAGAIAASASSARTVPSAPSPSIHAVAPVSSPHQPAAAVPPLTPDTLAPSTRVTTQPAVDPAAEPVPSQPLSPFPQTQQQPATIANSSQPAPSLPGGRVVKAASEQADAPVSTTGTSTVVPALRPNKCVNPSRLVAGASVVGVMKGDAPVSSLATSSRAGA